MAIVEKQFHERRRPSKPVFVPAIVTSHGEIGPDFIRLMEWVTAAYKSTLKNAPPRADGRKPEYLTAVFRKHLREKLLVATAKGTARLLRDAGLSKMACRKHNRW